MPFQNAPANVVCGAKINRDEAVVVRYNEKIGREFFFNMAGRDWIFY
jgi:hypothetical protein